MGYFFQGMQFGLALALLVGPLVLALVQASLEYGRKAGLWVGMGIWISDLLFILAVYFGIPYVEKIVKWQHFEPVMGGVGAVVLAGFGLATLLTPAPGIHEDQLHLTGNKRPAAIIFWLKGFLINTVNPFTFFFWLSAMGGFVLESRLDERASAMLFAGILVTLVVTDGAKVFAARAIRRKLKPRHLRWLRKTAGLALLIFGAILLARSF
jgi:threonine/homoserine/homoserine lactone efflux protein